MWNIFFSGLKGTIGTSGGAAATQQQKVLPSEECGKLSNRTDLLPGNVLYICLSRVASS